MTIRCLIIDDEPSSQNILKHFINDVDFLDLITVCNSALDAMEALKSHTNIDLLFLDINMPKISGLTFYKSLQHKPHVIFTTAYPQYAIDGFEVNAIDYLLKPFSFDRFFTAANKVFDLKNNVKQTMTDQDFIMVKSNKALHKIVLNDLLFAEAFGDYVKLHRKEDCILTNSTFTELLESLPSEKFIRIHKSFAINIDSINSVVGNKVNIDSKSVPIGQTYKSAFLERLDKNN